MLVAKDGNAAADQWQHGKVADEMLVALVLGMNRDAGVAEHRLRPRRGDGDELVRALFDGIFQIPERALGLAALDFEVADRGVQLRVPIDQPLIAIDQALAMELDEDAAHRGREPLVHGEALARPIRRGAERAQLARDRAAGFGFPLPDALDEFLAAELMAIGLLGFELALDHHLRRDAGVIGAGLPQRVEPLHAVVAGEDVLQREGQRVAHMQAARDIGRRHHDAIGLGHAVGMTGESAGVFPRFVNRRLDGGRVECLVEHAAS